MNANPKQYFKDLQTLLKLEQEADKQEQEDNKKDISVRALEGQAWYPVRIQSIRKSHEEDFRITLERIEHIDVPHYFKVGKTVAIFNEMGNETPLLGRILAVYDNFASSKLWAYKSSMVTNNIMIISVAENLKEEELEILPSWLEYGSLGIEQATDIPTYRAMNTALQTCQGANINNSLGKLISVLIGNRAATYNENRKLPAEISQSDRWNSSQKEALQNIYQAKEVALIHGPPGTGKTTTLVEAIRLTAKEESRILVTAPSNKAVDLLTERIAASGLKVLRIGNASKFGDTVEQYSIDKQVENHIDYPLLSQLRTMAQECRDIIGSNKLHPLNQQLETLKKEVKVLEKYIHKALLTEVKVITSTLGSVKHASIKNLSFSTVFIDEAGQALEPACWIPITASKRVILAGDHQQLPPVVKSKEAKSEGVGLIETLFEKLIKKQDTVRSSMLLYQYRMHEKIMSFSNEAFYDGKLDIDPQREDIRFQALTTDKSNLVLYQPIEFIDTSGMDGIKEQTDPDTQSKYNPEEAKLLVAHLFQLLNELQKMPDSQEKKLSIGIISPYRAQIKEIQRRLGSIDQFRIPYSDTDTQFIDLEVNSVDGFQGHEKDIIYLSLVRSNPDGSIGFLSETRRLNVAITRAKKKLVIVGNRTTVEKDAFFKKFIAEMELLGAFRGAAELPIGRSET